MRLIAVTVCGAANVNKTRYRTSARITKVLPGTGRTDRQTDGQSATQYAAPSYGGRRRIIKLSVVIKLVSVKNLYVLRVQYAP